MAALDLGQPVFRLAIRFDDLRSRLNEDSALLAQGPHIDRFHAAARMACKPSSVSS